MAEPKLFSKSIVENMVRFQGAFDDSMDFIVREFKITGTPAALLSIEGLVDKQTVAQSIMNPILKAPVLETEPEQKMKFLRDDVLSAVDQSQIVEFEDALQRMMSGFAVLMMDGVDWVLAFGVQGFAYRSITEPNNETAQRGSREGFTEPLQINMSMIRRRMKTPDLKFERMTVGEKSKTIICLCYLRSVVSKEILEKVKENINQIHLETVMEAGYLTPFLEKRSIFNGIGLSERPDTVCGKISEGRIAILVDGTPNVIIIPYLFVENFQSFDDYVIRPFYATFIRWLKYLAFFVAMFLPGVYVAVVTFHPELLPETLLIKIAQAEASTPFPIMLEAIVIHFLYEIMREAGLRVPKPLGHAVSIVGALVIGDTAVTSGLIGAPTLMVIALTAISSYVAPNLYEPIALMRLVFILIGGLMGLWAIMLAFGFLLINICTESVYQIPFTAPLSPFSRKSMRDVLIRADWRTLSKRTSRVQDMPGSNVRKL